MLQGVLYFVPFNYMFWPISSYMRTLNQMLFSITLCHIKSSITSVLFFVYLWGSKSSSNHCDVFHQHACSCACIHVPLLRHAAFPLFVTRSHYDVAMNIENNVNKEILAIIITELIWHTVHVLIKISLELHPWIIICKTFFSCKTVITTKNTTLCFHYVCIFLNVNILCDHLTVYMKQAF